MLNKSKPRNNLDNLKIDNKEITNPAGLHKLSTLILQTLVLN